MPPARHGAPAPWGQPLRQSPPCARPSAQVRNRSVAVSAPGAAPHLRPTAARTPVEDPPLSRSLPLRPCYRHTPRLPVPLTRGFGGSFREDEPQRGGMGHGAQDRLSEAQGWFPSIFSIRTARTTATRWLRRGQAPKFLLPKNSPGVCLSAGMTCGSHRMPAARNSCLQHFQQRLDNGRHVAL